MQVLSYVQRRGVSLIIHMSNPYASGATSTRQSHGETDLTWQPRSGDRRPSLDRCRLPGLSRLRPVLILSPTSTSQEFHSAQAHAPQRPMVYVTALSLFRLERQATGALVVDSMTGREAHMRSVKPEEAPSAAASQRATGNDSHRATRQEALLLRRRTVKLSAIRM